MHPYALDLSPYLLRKMACLCIPLRVRLCGSLLFLRVLFNLWMTHSAVSPPRSVIVLPSLWSKSYF